jgi:hypothetical protein
MEALALAGLALLALLSPARPSQRGGMRTGRLLALARDPGRSALWIGLSCLVLHLLVIPVTGIPEPFIHDEFSYLLAADTFASFRAANPQHPMWKHFESFHVNQTPTYVSMYPPGQGLVLAAGQILTGYPIAGVWLSSALLCGLICWTLHAWVPPPWAVVGGMIAILRIGMFSYWANSYWGGALAGIGGCLLLGAFPRLLESPRPRYGALVGLACVILAVTRPWEGFVLAVLVSVPYAVLLLRKHGPRSLAAPLAAGCAALAAGSLGWCGYNFRTTGEVLKTPYAVNRETYAAAQHFVWQSPRPPPPYRHDPMRHFYAVAEVDDFQKLRTFGSWLDLMKGKAESIWFFYAGPALTLALLAAPFAMTRRIGFLLAVLGLWFAAQGLIGWWLQAHYAAPLTALIYVLMVHGLMTLWSWRWRNGAVGPYLVKSILIVCLVMVGIRFFTGRLGILTGVTPLTWYNLLGQSSRSRPDIEKRLVSQGGNHLVLVRRDLSRLSLEEWVYNKANIDASRVVWARDMGQAGNDELLRYYRDRQCWLLEPEDSVERLTPCQAGI